MSSLFNNLVFAMEMEEARYAPKSHRIPLASPSLARDNFHSTFVDAGGSSEDID